MRAAVHKIYGAVSPFFRKRRMKRFLQAMHPTAAMTILDVGGYPGNWETVSINSDVTTLNLHPVPPPNQASARIRVAVGDGCNLPYPDKSFDVVFSNSVIEHVGTLERQRAFAREARRVGKALWIQTPARGFFIEPHLMAPFIHYLPQVLQRRLIRLTPWAIVGKPTSEEIEQHFREVRLLSKAEFEQLFPDCEIQKECFAGLTKSFIAFRSASST